MNWQTTIIPALPGTYKLDSSEFTDGTASVCKTPVVAWVIAYSDDDKHIFTTTHPVTLGIGNYTSRGLCSGETVLLPCGSVEDMGTGSGWDTYEDYVRSYEASMKREKDKND